MPINPETAPGIGTPAAGDAAGSSAAGLGVTRIVGAGHRATGIGAARDGATGNGATGNGATGNGAASPGAASPRAAGIGTADADAADAAAPRRQAALVRALVAVLLVVVVAAGIVAIRIWPDAISQLIDQATALERALGAAGWVLAALVQVVIALCGILPASVGALAAGLLYGVVGGFCVSAFGTLVGAALAFALTRTLFRPVIARLLERRPRFRRLDQAVARDGWRLVCLLRISPVMPFAVTSYALGLSSLAFRSYAIGTLASLPALLGYVVLGHLSGNGLAALAAHQTGWLHWCLLGLAIGATALLTLKLGGLLRQALRLPASP